MLREAGVLAAEMDRQYHFRENIEQLPPKPAGRAGGDAGLRPDQGEQPFAPSPKVIEAVSQWVRRANRYPDPGQFVLRRALADYTGCRPEQIVAGNGSDEIIDTIIRCSVGPGDEILAPVPTFYYYERSVLACGGKASLVPMDAGFRVNVAELLRRAGPRTKVIFLANPNNPTGRLTPRPEVIRLIRESPCLVAVDECYFEFSGVTVADELRNFGNLLVIRSFSKGFGLAGLRLGYCLGEERLIRGMHSAVQAFPVNGAAQAAGLAALEDLDYTRGRIEVLKSERERMAEQLRMLGLRPLESAANFLFVETLATGRTSGEISERLRERGVAIWDGSKAPGGDAYHFRVTVGDRRQNDRLIEELGEVLASRDGRAAGAPAGR